ncbi:MAG: thymidylate kinase [bacterium]
MEKNSNPGKFIVLDGIDGSGKATQIKLLLERLRGEGYPVEKIDFPQYGKKSAGLVEEYLNGKYGKAEDVGPYRASVFYACDRYDASFLIKTWLDEGKIVIADRYLSSNIGHQAGKIKDKDERKAYLKWLYNLEYGIFGIPRPDVTIILKVPPAFSQQLIGKTTDAEKVQKRSSYLGGKEKDIHEANAEHLFLAFNSYLEAAEEFPEEFQLLECVEAGQLLSPDEVHQRVYQVVKEILQKA